MFPSPYSMLSDVLRVGESELLPVNNQNKEEELSALGSTPRERETQAGVDQTHGVLLEDERTQVCAQENTEIRVSPSTGPSLS